MTGSVVSHYIYFLGNLKNSFAKYFHINTFIEKCLTDLA
jgi:hypothetical protein